MDLLITDTAHGKYLSMYAIWISIEFVPTTRCTVHWPAL